MFEPGRATFEGEYASVPRAINEPKGIQKPRIPIIVGGNGRNVTFRYAAKYADEINLVYLSPDGVAELLPIIRARCEEIDRDPATLRVSLYSRDDDVRAGRPGAGRHARRPSRRSGSTGSCASRVAGTSLARWPGSLRGGLPRGRAGDGPGGPRA